jgi:hypothetical protein
MTSNKRYFVVNPSGAVHEVTYDHASARLRQPGFRMAEAAEIEKYFNQATQRADKPIARPWNPEPEEAVQEDIPEALVQYEVANAVPEPAQPPMNDVSRLDIEEKLKTTLLGAGFDTVDDLAGASDEELLAVKGVGPAAIAKVREAVAAFIGE